MISSKYFFAYCLDQGIKHMCGINMLAYLASMNFCFKFKTDRLFNEDFIAYSCGPVIPSMHLSEFPDVQRLMPCEFNDRRSTGFYIRILDELEYVLSDEKSNEVGIDSATMICFFEDVLRTYWDDSNLLVITPTFIWHPDGAWKKIYVKGEKNVISPEEIMVHYINVMGTHPEFTYSLIGIQEE